MFFKPDKEVSPQYRRWVPGPQELSGGQVDSLPCQSQPGLPVPGEPPGASCNLPWGTQLCPVSFASRSPGDGAMLMGANARGPG